MTRDSCVSLSFVGLGLDWLGWGRSALLGATLITDPNHNASITRSNSENLI